MTTHTCAVSDCPVCQERAAWLVALVIVLVIQRCLAASLTRTFNGNGIPR